MRFTLLFIISTTLITSCNSSLKENGTVENIDLEIKILDLTSEIETLKQLKKSPEYTTQVKDSIGNLITQKNQYLGSIINISGTDYATSLNKCVHYFKLHACQSDSSKMEYLKIYYAYKVCVSGWISCGFNKVTSIEQLNKKISLIQKKTDAYNHYIDSLVAIKREKAFPEIQAKELHDFDLVTFHYFKDTYFNEGFKQSACEMAKTDTTFNRLYAEKLSAYFAEAK